eukprot:UN03825
MKYHCKTIFFFFCKITIYKANLGIKMYIVKYTADFG